MSSTASLRASSHVIFAHYFTPFPITIDNKPADADYYALQYLRPQGENGKHAYCGGFLRDRPVPRAPLTGNWTLIDMEKEVSEAIAAGLDGFIVDILSLDPANVIWTRVLKLLDAAAAVDPGFKVASARPVPLLMASDRSHARHKCVKRFGAPGPSEACCVNGAVRIASQQLSSG